MPRIWVRWRFGAEADTEDAPPVCWAFQASLAGENAGGATVADAEMGWLFSRELLGLLQELRRERLQRDAATQAATR